MLRDAWFIARNDLLHSLREKETILWTFIMPIMFFYFIGTITGGMGDGNAATERDRLSVQVPDNAGFLADEVILRLEAGGFEVVPAGSPQEFAASRRRLAIPDGFTENVLAGRKAVVIFSRPNDDMTTSRASTIRFAWRGQFTPSWPTWS